MIHAPDSRCGAKQFNRVKFPRLYQIAGIAIGRVVCSSCTERGGGGVTHVKTRSWRYMSLSQPSPSPVWGRGVFHRRRSRIVAHPPNSREAGSSSHTNIIRYSAREACSLSIRRPLRAKPAHRHGTASIGAVRCYMWLPSPVDATGTAPSIIGPRSRSW